MACQDTRAMNKSEVGVEGTVRRVRGLSFLRGNLYLGDHVCVCAHVQGFERSWFAPNKYEWQALPPPANRNLKGNGLYQRI